MTMTKYTIEMTIPSGMDPSSLLERMQEIAVEVAEECHAEDDESDGDELTEDAREAIRNEVSVCETAKLAATHTIGDLTFEVPALDHDAMMLARFGHTVGPIGLIERRVVAALCAHLAKHDWKPCEVNDGDDRTTVKDAKGAMELIFNLDDAWLTFAKGKHRHWVRLVMGNSGWDVINDWSFSQGDADGFNKAMEAFDAEKFA